MNLHNQILNLPCGRSPTWPHRRDDYNQGQLEARQAACELAQKADACIDALRELDKRVRECSAIPACAADVYDSFYRAMVEEALAAVG